MKEYEIWQEGFMVQGGSCKAFLLTTIKAESFDDAVKIYAEKNPGQVEKITRERYHTDEDFNNRRSNWMIWGCQLFDNEQDARKSWG